MMLRASGCGSNLFPESHATVSAAKSVNMKSEERKNQQVQRGTDHRFPQASRGWRIGQGRVTQGGVSDATFYKWRAMYGGMDVPDARRLRDLEGENAKLKRLLVEAHLDMHALKSVLGVTR